MRLAPPQHKQSPEREDAPVVVAHHAQAAHGQRLGAVALSQDERALGAVARASIVGVRQLRHACSRQAERAAGQQGRERRAGSESEMARGWRQRPLRHTQHSRHRQHAISGGSASSSGTPVSLLRLVPSLFLSSFWFLNAAKLRMLSITPHLATLAAAHTQTERTQKARRRMM